MDGTKEAIRREMRRRRGALSAARRASAERAVAGYLVEIEPFRAAPAILAYVARGNEVPTGAALGAAFAAGKRVYLPRLTGTAMRFAAHAPGSELRRGAFGIPAPVGPEIEDRELAQALALVPLLAWDTTGSRLGRGGGHYDRAVAGPARPRCLVGLGYTFQQHPALPRDPWDLRLDLVITELGVVRCWSGGGRPPEGKEDSDCNGISGDGVGDAGACGGAGLVGGLPATAAGGRAGARVARDCRAGAG